MTRTKISLLAAAAVLLSAAPSYAWRGGGFHDRFFVGVGPGWWVPPPYAYVYEPPPVIVEEQPPPVVASAPPYYYCASTKAYYPTVPTCPESWIKVPPPR